MHCMLTFLKLHSSSFPNILTKKLAPIWGLSWKKGTVQIANLNGSGVLAAE